MPRQINLPQRPQVVFGVFNRWGAIIQPYARHDGPCIVGHQVMPNYWRRAVRATAAEAEADMPAQLEAWAKSVQQTKMNEVTLADVLTGRTFLRYESISWGGRFYLTDTEFVRVEPSRGYYNVRVEGPVDQPFTVKRVLATHRAIRLEDGQSLTFDRKVILRRENIPTAILDEIFSS